MKLPQIKILISLILSFFEREFRKPAVRRVLIETRDELNRILESEET